MNNKVFGIIAIIVAILMIYVGTTMFYNTGLAITDLNVQQNNSNSSEYDVSYMLRSIRGFNKVIIEYKLLDKDNKVIGQGSDELNEIKDGSFQINDKVSLDNSSSEAKKIEIKLCEKDESNNQKEIFDQTFDI